MDATYRCIKPHCPVDCDQCRCAIPTADTARVLVAELLDAFAIDGYGGTLEDGESAIVDRARAFLNPARQPAAPLAADGSDC